MSNNYSWASFAIPTKDPELARKRLKNLEDWMHEEIETLDSTLFTEEQAKSAIENLEEWRDWGWPLDVTIEELDGKHMICLSHNESIQMEVAVVIAQIMLDVDENNEIYTAEWADVCDRPRIDQFGGGAVAFNRYTSVWSASGTMADHCRKQVEAKPRG